MVSSCCSQCWPRASSGLVATKDPACWPSVGSCTSSSRVAISLPRRMRSKRDRSSGLLSLSIPDCVHHCRARSHRLHMVVHGKEAGSVCCRMTADSVERLRTADILQHAYELSSCITRQQLISMTDANVTSYFHPGDLSLRRSSSGKLVLDG
jgi:hypothetical protein